jgi:hypothetical protein
MKPPPPKQLFTIASEEPTCHAHSICACGCGEVRPRLPGVSKARYAARKYINGHFFRDPKNAEKIADLVARRAAKRKGQKNAPEFGKRARAWMQKAWEEGRFNGRNMDKSIARLSAMRSKIDFVKNGPKWSAKLKAQKEKWATDGTAERNRKAVIEAQQKDWHVRDPNGVRHQFTNLNEWARNNGWRFVDDRPHSKKPLWKRISQGIGMLGYKNGRVTSYRGWVLVSGQEYIIGEGADPLERDSFNQQ